MNKIPSAAIAIACSLLAGCAVHQSANTYTAVNAQKKLKVSYAVITGLRDITLEHAASGTGGVAGAGIGGTLGSSAGQGRTGIIGALAGAVMGGLTGEGTDKAASNDAGLEITYRMEKTGEEFVTAQAKRGSEALKIGQRVRLIESEKSARIVAAE